MSSGKRSFFIDDISGFKERYKKARTQWDGIRTVSTEFSEKHPQLTPARPRKEAQALPGARPDNDPTNVTINFLANNLLRLNIYSYLGSIYGEAEALPTGVTITPSLGTAYGEAETFPSGLSGSFSLASIFPVPAVEGVSASSAVGTIFGELSTFLTGFAIVSALGSVSITVTSDGWGQDTWGSGPWGQ